MCLAPVFLVILAQAVGLGYSMTLGSTVPLSDSNIWASCASALAAGDESYNMAWCLRRPLTIVAQSPLFLLAPKSMAAVVLIQLLVVCLALWWFLVALARAMPVGRIGLLIVYALSLWPVLSYGTYVGPEVQTLWLSFVSAAAIVTYLRTRAIGWGVLSGCAAILAFQIRPGNAVLTAALAIGVIVLTWRRDRRVWAALAIAFVFLGTWLLPPRILAMNDGWTQAGHAANFWSAAYSAATPEDDSWEIAYERFAPEVGCPTPAQWTADPCLALESEEFGQLMRDQAIELMKGNPKAVVRQLLVNTRVLVSDGYLNQMWATPIAPAWQIWKADARAALLNSSSGLITAGATLVWAASWVLLAMLCMGLFRIRRLRGPPQASDSNDNEPNRDDQSSTVALVLALGLVAILGAAATFALVGHTEPQRHLVQNVPFIVAAVAALACLPWQRQAQSLPTSAPWRRAPKWAAIAIACVVAALVIGAGIEGRLPSPSVQVSRSCDVPVLQDYDVVGTASVGSELPVGSPDDWRKIGTPQISLLFSGQSYYVQQNLNRLPPGTVLDLRSQATGEVIPVFVSDETLRAQALDGSSGWCTRTPSQYDVMLVHDLVPLS
ncbi:MAG: hypothetical protein Q7K25_00230 [Actinomycetota bacterium]|nr:hypothetical protein [Actinomycetota bacterium]